MATSDFLPFATGVGADVQSQADYAAASSTSNGFSNGIAEPAQLNKVWRQSSFISAAIAAWLSGQGINVPDNGDLNALVANLTSTIVSKGSVVDSVAAVRALDSTKVNRAVTTGYWTLGDGGSGSYGVNPSDTTSADNGGTILVGTDGARWYLLGDAWLNVKQFGAVGTANTGNVTKDTPAFANAMATGRNIFVPDGYYYTSATISVGYAQCLWGNGRGKTFISYTGTGTCGIYVGGPGNVTLIYDCEVRDLTLSCTNKVTPASYGIMVENAVYFCLDSLSVIGAFNPNLSEALVGSGIYITNNSIIGRVSRVSARLWKNGYYLKTLPASQSYWTAAIVIDGQGEVANNMFGMVIGDPTVNLYSGVGVSIRDMSVQGNYSGGIVVNSGDNTVVEANYFEGNGNFDVQIGSLSGSPQTIGCKVIDNSMESEDLSGSPYGSAPYVAKVKVLNGVLTKIRDNNMAISTSIPVIILGSSAADRTSITGNRLTSTISSNSIITNNGINSIIQNNDPNPAGVFGLTLTINPSQTYTIGITDQTVLNGYAGGTTTLTLPNPTTTQINRQLRITNQTAHAVISSANNVVGNTNALSTSILPATAGAWADIQNDGTYWRMTASGIGF